jgi:hypothetical protein
MTTFTTDDREEAYKKILKDAPNQPGYEDAVPIPFNGLALKELTDDEMELAYYECFGLKNKMPDNEKRRSYFKFARVILRKAREK